MNWQDSKSLDEEENPSWLEAYPHDDDTDDEDLNECFRQQVAASNAENAMLRDPSYPGGMIIAPDYLALDRKVKLLAIEGYRIISVIPRGADAYLVVFQRERGTSAEGRA